MDKEDINNYKLKLKTEQAGAFRILVEALKEILTEANFSFDESGIKLNGNGFNTHNFNSYEIRIR